MNKIIAGTKIITLIAATALWAGGAAAREDDAAADAPTPPSAPTPSSAPTAPVPPTPPSQIVIQTIESDDADKEGKEVAWLGVATQESSEALSSQLGLKVGAGLIIVWIAPGSPAEKAGFHKNDVLAELDGQMLVHPLQIRKLVQMHAEGDPIQLTYYRAGKKETVSVKLAKTISGEMSDAQDESVMSLLHGHQIKLKDDLRGLDRARVNLDRSKMNFEVNRTMQETRKAIQDAVQHASSDRSLAAVDHELAALAGGGVSVDKDATVIVRNKHDSNKTMFQTDDSGTYVVEAGEKTRLTVHDKDGKLLFEGTIDTKAEQEKVPKEVWEKVKSMLDQITAPADLKPSGESKAGNPPNS